MTINLEKSLDINAAIQDVFNIWRDLPSASRLLPNGRDAHLELTEQLESQRLSWKIIGPEVASTVTVALAPSEENHRHTKVTLTAHYPNGLGASTPLRQITSDMDNGLANVARLLNGEAWVDNQEHDTDPPTPSLYPEVTESAETLYRTWTSATEAWATSVNQGFQIFSSLAWLPLQASFAAREMPSPSSMPGR